MKSNQQAFTLIELLVVVLIIGILTAVAVPQYQKTVMRSRFATIKNLTRSIANAQELYYLANGKYASSFKELDIGVGGTPENENDAQRNFDWGHCRVTTSGIMCMPKIKVAYIIYYKNISKSNKGKTYCTPASNSTTLPRQHQFCQQETGSSTYEGTYRYLYRK